MPFNWKKHYAIKNQYKQTIGKDIPQKAGIYLWTREENGITFFYVGQAKNLYNRRFNYYCVQCGLNYPSRHFEASLKKHKDWKFFILKFVEEWELDFWEKYYIDKYNALPNHITRNEMIANVDMVQSNAKRIDKAINKYQSRLKELLNRVQIDIYYDVIKISCKRNKTNTYNKISLDAINELKEWINGLRKPS